MSVNASKFTIVETLAAMLVIAIVIPVAIAGMRMTSRAESSAYRREIAARLGNNMLQEMVATEAWEGSESSGDFGEDYPNYSWELEVLDWADDTPLKHLTITVFYPVQGTDHSLTLDVLVQSEETTTEVVE